MSILVLDQDSIQQYINLHNIADNRQEQLDQIKKRDIGYYSRNVVILSDMTCLLFEKYGKQV